MFPYQNFFLTSTLSLCLHHEQKGVYVFTHLIQQGESEDNHVTERRLLKHLLPCLPSLVRPVFVGPHAEWAGSFQLPFETLKEKLQDSQHTSLGTFFGVPFAFFWWDKTLLAVFRCWFGAPSQESRWRHEVETTQHEEGGVVVILLQQCPLCHFKDRHEIFRQRSFLPAGKMRNLAIDGHSKSKQILCFT